MKLRPEFELLDLHFQQLRCNLGIDQGYLAKVRDDIRLCEHIVKEDYEKSVIVRTTYWWRKRASVFGMDMEVKLLAGTTRTKEEVEADDRIFLRSLRIAADDEEDSAST
jgi:hypothetical protein